MSWAATLTLGQATHPESTPGRLGVEADLGAFIADALTRQQTRQQPERKPTRGTAETPAIPRSRGERIRTSDPLTPSQVR